MKITLHFGSSKMTLEGDLEDVRRNIDSGIARKQLIPFTDKDNLIIYVAAHNITRIQAHEVYKRPEVKVVEAPKLERIKYTDEQLLAQPLLAMDAYGQNVATHTTRP